MNTTIKETFEDFNNYCIRHISSEDVSRMLQNSIYNKSTFKTFSDILSMDGLLNYRTIIHLITMDGLEISDMISIAGMNIKGDDLTLQYLLKDKINRMGYGYGFYMDTIGLDSISKTYIDVLKEKNNKLESTRSLRSKVHKQIYDNVVFTRVSQNIMIKDDTTAYRHDDKNRYSYKSTSNLKSDYNMYVLEEALSKNELLGWTTYENPDVRFYEEFNKKVYEVNKSLTHGDEAQKSCYAPDDGYISELYVSVKNNSKLSKDQKIGEYTSYDGKITDILAPQDGYLIRVRYGLNQSCIEGKELLRFSPADLKIDNLPKWHVDDSTLFLYARNDCTIINKFSTGDYVTESDELFDDGIGYTDHNARGYITYVVEDGSSVTRGDIVAKLRKHDDKLPWLYDMYNINKILGTYIYNTYNDTLPIYSTHSDISINNEWDTFKNDPLNFSIDNYKSLEELDVLLKTEFGKNIYKKVLYQFNYKGENILKEDLLHFNVNAGESCILELNKEFMSSVLNYSPGYKKDEAVSFMYSLASEIGTTGEYEIDINMYIEYLLSISKLMYGDNDSYKVRYFELNVLQNICRVINHMDDNTRSMNTPDLELISPISVIGKDIDIKLLETDLDTIFRVIHVLSSFLNDVCYYSKTTIKQIR